LVRLIAPKSYYYTVPRGVSSDVSMRLVYKGPLVAPIAKGDRVAELEMMVGAEEPVRVVLVAGDDVPRGGVLDRFRAGFMEFFQ
jgi:D-alanyl-D-alanine carboxypeptidase (penicillin-binding protein 5/6)